MVVPIGIDPLNGIVAAYSTVTGDLGTLNIEKITPSDSDKIDSQFKLIKEHFPAFSYNVCVCVNENYSNDIRLAFVENAKNHGFMNFSILDFSSALYIHAVFKSAFKSKTGDDVWIFWKEHCYVYEHIRDSIVFWQSYPNLTKTNINILAKLEKPVAVFYQLNTTKIANDLYPDARYYYFSTFLAENAALIKSQFLMDNKMPSLKITPCCGRKIEIFVNEKICLTIVPEQTLPYENIVEIMDASNILKLKIVEDDIEVKELVVDSTSVEFSIDLNGIYSIKTMDDKEILYDTVETTSCKTAIEDASADPISNPNDSEDGSLLHEGEDEKEYSIQPPNIKLATPNYIIPEKFDHFVEMVYQLGYIQTELNILNSLILIITTEFDFNNFDYLKECHASYKPAIVHLETLLENIIAQIHGENNEFGINNLKGTIDSIIQQHADLEQKYEKNEKFLKNAEKYLADFDQEMEWIDSKLNNNEMKFDNFENCINAVNFYETLKLEVKDHEKNYQQIIEDGKTFINNSNNETIEAFIESITNSWKKLEEYLQFHSTIIPKVQKAVKCCKKADTIQEWINFKNQQFSQNDSNTGSEIVKEMLMKKTKKLLDDVESYYEHIDSFKKDANSIKSEIYLSRTLIKLKLSLILNVLQNRMDDVITSYTKLKENVIKQIQKLDEEKATFKFTKQCNAIERRIKEAMEFVNVEITKNNNEMVKMSMIAAEDSLKSISTNEIKAIKESGEKLFAAGFSDAKLQNENIEKQLTEADKILKEKQKEIKDFVEFQLFLSNCDIIIQRILIQMEAINLVSDINHLEENRKDQKRFSENIDQLVRTCTAYKSKNINYANEMDGKINELQEANKSLTSLIEAKSQALQNEELTKFFDKANEILDFFEHIMSEMEYNDAIDISANVDILMEDHQKLKEQLLSKKNDIKEIEEMGKQLIQKSPSSKDISGTLEKITNTKKELNQTWKNRYDEYQEIKHLASFNAIADETISVLKEYYEFLKNNEDKNIDKVEMEKMMREVNLHIDSLQETAHRVIEIKENLATVVNAKVNEILEMHSQLINSSSSHRCRSPSDPVDPTPPHTPHIETQNYLIPKKLKNYDDKINAVGIDLGTSRCVVAVSRNNKMETVALENTGERPLPSFVSFDEEQEKCGEIVVHGLSKGKEKFTCFDVKRIIGKSFHDIISDKSWPFTVVEDEGRVMIKTETKIGGEVMKTPEEISAVLLKYMKEKVSTFQGKVLTEAVLTFPATFTESQKQATLEAAKLAGWDKIHLLPEPVAASFAYFNNRDIPDNSNVLLFDLGGGTLDVCIFKIIDGTLQIIANNGDTCLGGRDIDNLLISHFATILKYKYQIDTRNKLKRRYQLMLACQKIKHNLTIREHDILDAETFDTNVEGTIEIERHELEEMAMNLIHRMRSAVNQTLKNANLSHKDINKVLLVGGGCRMPIVQEILQKMFPQAENCREEHPDEVVAVGAAIYAYHLATL